MSDLTRLGFVKSSVGAAVGMTAIGSIVASQAEASDDIPAGSEAVLAFVKDPSKGEISVLSGDREVIVHDRSLAAKISRAAR